MAQRTFKPSHRKSVGRNFNGDKKIDNMYDWGSGWRKYSQRFLAINKECYACGKPSEVVDHLKPHQGDIGLFRKLDNHIPLCTTCHNTVTAKFDRNYRQGNPITEKIRWLSRNRMPTEKWTPKRVRVLPSFD